MGTRKNEEERGRTRKNEEERGRTRKNEEEKNMEKLYHPQPLLKQERSFIIKPPPFFKEEGVGGGLPCSRYLS
jgi:hypothetical protein